MVGLAVSEVMIQESVYGYGRGNGSVRKGMTVTETRGLSARMLRKGLREERENLEVAKRECKDIS